MPDFDGCRHVCGDGFAGDEPAPAVKPKPQVEATFEVDAEHGGMAAGPFPLCRDNSAKPEAGCQK